MAYSTQLWADDPSTPLSAQRLRHMETGIQRAAARADASRPDTWKPASTDITDATTTGKALITASDAAVARTAIGAGTSSLILGATGTTAKAGDWMPTWNDVQSKPTTFTPPTATSSVVGGVKQAGTQADSTATDVAGLLADFNNLLAKLRAAGIIAS